jgi:hypothetical protein
MIVKATAMFRSLAAVSIIQKRPRRVSFAYLLRFLVRVIAGDSSPAKLASFKRAPISLPIFRQNWKNLAIDRNRRIACDDGNSRIPGEARFNARKMDVRERARAGEAPF